MFRDKVKIAGVVFHSKTGQAGWGEPISLTPMPPRPEDTQDVHQFTVHENHAANFMAWLTTPGGGRFISVNLKLDRKSGLAMTYDTSHPWSFEAEVVGVGEDVFMIVPLNEKPNFTWRERTSGARMLCANYREKPKYLCTYK
jgi:hypothetical protein